MLSTQYTHDDFVRDLPEIVSRLQGRQLDGVTSMPCCCPKQWAQMLAQRMSIPYIEFNKRTNRSVELRVYVGGMDVGVSRVYALHASRDAQRYLYDFRHGALHPVTFKV